jgi:hypothetical protein
LDMDLVAGESSLRVIFICVTFSRMHTSHSCKVGSNRFKAFGKIICLWTRNPVGAIVPSVNRNRNSLDMDLVSQVKVLS